MKLSTEIAAQVEAHLLKYYPDTYDAIADICRSIETGARDEKIMHHCIAGDVYLLRSGARTREAMLEGSCNGSMEPRVWSAYVDTLALFIEIDSGEE